MSVEEERGGHDRPDAPGDAGADDTEDLLGDLERVDGLLGEGIGARLERWAADARIEAAARRRARERWLRQQAEEEATFAGVLADLGEHGVEVTLHTGSGRAHRGRVGVVGADFVGLRPAPGVPGGGEILVALAVVASVRTHAGARPVTGDRVVTSRLSLVEVITGLAAERERVVLVLAGGADTVGGTLQSIGQDVVVVRLDDGPAASRPATAYVSLAAIAEVIV